MADIDTRVAVYTDVVKAEGTGRRSKPPPKPMRSRLQMPGSLRTGTTRLRYPRASDSSRLGVRAPSSAAVVGIVFPPSIIASAAFGAGGGGLDLGHDEAARPPQGNGAGDAFDSGTWAIIVAYPTEHATQVADILKDAKSTWTGVSATDEEVEKAISDAS